MKKFIKNNIVKIICGLIIICLVVLILLLKPYKKEKKVKNYYRFSEDIVETPNTVVNKTNVVQSGYLKLVFGDKKFIIIYSDVLPGLEKSNTSYFNISNLKLTDDYILEELSEEDKNRIIK